MMRERERERISFLTFDVCNTLESIEYLFSQQRQRDGWRISMVVLKIAIFRSVAQSSSSFSSPSLSSSSVCQLVSRSTARGNDLGHGGDRSFESCHVQRKNVAKTMLDYVMFLRCVVQLDPVQAESFAYGIFTYFALSIDNQARIIITNISQRLNNQERREFMNNRSQHKGLR